MMSQVVKVYAQPDPDEVVFRADGWGSVREVIVDAREWAAMGCPEVVDVYVYAPDQVSPVVSLPTL